MHPAGVAGFIRTGLDYTLGPRTVAQICRLDLETSLKQELANFSIKVQIGNILVFLGHVASVTTLNPVVIGENSHR